ncbi:GGDEF domain-containing protein [Pseudomonas typographi]|uniref:diguanylate cyclase n=1 Tax=Pseudomonas typographi TaxID=2715964 RepID=A0ABR7Z4F6_9PSED|nr:GGDEF domain-containing protein [Pseudomonas typographi]MBD1600278.1 diguanylate cyclase [Pseudomonas typographi]
MTDDAQRWKEKYLKSLEEQEQLERRWAARLDLLRRGLVRSTLAAEGADKAVDACMKEMREVVRSDDMDAALAGLIPRLEKAVLDSEQRRQARVNDVATALGALVNQLQALPLPREASKPLKKFAGSLDKRATQSRELPVLLGELSSLQGQALASLEAGATRPHIGLLQRLFGPRREAHRETPAGPGENTAMAAPSVAGAPADEPVPAATAEATAPIEATPQAAAPAATPAATATAAPQATPEPVGLAAAPAPPPQLEAEPAPQMPPSPGSLPAEPPATPVPHTQAEAEAPAPAPAPASLPLPEHATLPQATAPAEGHSAVYALPETPEPSYSSVAAHIESTLLGMLDDLSLPEKLRPLANAMRQRLASGLNWYELLPLLDDVAVLVLAISDHGQLELQRYLALLNERFDQFIDQLHAASDGHAQGLGATERLDESLREQVGSLRESVAQARDAEGLKRVMETRFEGLIGTLDQHRKQRETCDREVAERLQGLAARVASMEQQAQHYRESLEAQRQKALLDPLTGLPNRAAWGERLAQATSLREHDETPLHVAIFDLDHFKAINDTYGHLAGDKVLKIVATVLGRHLRPQDFLARFGGEEFVLLMPASTPEEAGALLETLREAIEACPFHFKGVRVTVTVSIGTTALTPKEAGEPALKRADQALYRAKGAGRNRIALG